MPCSVTEPRKISHPKPLIFAYLSSNTTTCVDIDLSSLLILDKRLSAIASKQAIYSLIVSVNCHDRDSWIAEMVRAAFLCCAGVLWLKKVHSHKGALLRPHPTRDRPKPIRGILGEKKTSRTERKHTKALKWDATNKKDCLWWRMMSWLWVAQMMCAFSFAAGAFCFT
jgi:hypothetical protein